MNVGCTHCTSSPLLLVQMGRSMIYKVGTKRTSKPPMSLLPKVLGPKLEDVVIDAGSVSVDLVGTSLPVACSVCGQEKLSLHGHDWHTMADLPWSGRREGAAGGEDVSLSTAGMPEPDRHRAPA